MASKPHRKRYGFKVFLRNRFYRFCCRKNSIWNFPFTAFSNLELFDSVRYKTNHKHCFNIFEVYKRINWQTGKKQLQLKRNNNFCIVTFWFSIWEQKNKNIGTHSVHELFWNKVFYFACRELLQRLSLVSLAIFMLRFFSNSGRRSCGKKNISIKLVVFIWKLIKHY